MPSIYSDTITLYLSPVDAYFASVYCMRHSPIDAYLHQAWKWTDWQLLSAATTGQWLQAFKASLKVPWPYLGQFAISHQCLDKEPSANFAWGCTLSHSVNRPLLERWKAIKRVSEWLKQRALHRCPNSPVLAGLHVTTYLFILLPSLPAANLKFWHKAPCLRFLLFTMTYDALFTISTRRKCRELPVLLASRPVCDHFYIISWAQIVHVYKFYHRF